jgi:hypothetical protein
MGAAPPLEVVTACPGVMEAQPGAMKTHHRAVDVSLSHMQAYPCFLRNTWWNGISPQSCKGSSWVLVVYPKPWSLTLELKSLTIELWRFSLKPWKLTLREVLREVDCPCFFFALSCSSAQRQNRMWKSEEKEKMSVKSNELMLFPPFAT